MGSGAAEAGNVDESAGIGTSERRDPAGAEAHSEFYELLQNKRNEFCGSQAWQYDVSMILTCTSAHKRLELPD